jgi:predicted metalloprotease with PDZ domain
MGKNGSRTTREIQRQVKRPARWTPMRREMRGGARAVQWTPAASGRQYFPRERVPEYCTKAAAVEGALVFRYLVQYCRNGLRIRVSVAPLVLPRQDGR